MKIETSIMASNIAAYAQQARSLEALGYDAVVAPEAGHDPFLPLMTVAEHTQTIKFGTAVAIAFPRSPMVVAEIGYDLQRQSHGRFHLGLGAQVKGHNERRFSVPWSPPAPRMREYVESLRAIWRCWEKSEPLHYEGKHYRFTLMTPEFSPPPTGLPRIPISIAAVGPAMLKVAGRVCDGVRLHGFATRKYVEEICLPKIDEGLAISGHNRRNFEIWGGGFVVTGANDEELQRQMEGIRYRVAFYGSTRSYHHVFRVHGWEDLGMKLHEMSKRGEWKKMPAEVPDDVLRSFAAVATYDELADTLESRFGGITDTLMLGFGDEVDRNLVSEILHDVKRIDSPFEGHLTDW